MHVAVDSGGTGLRARNFTLAQSHGAAATKGICAESFPHCTNVMGLQKCTLQKGYFETTLVEAFYSGRCFADRFVSLCQQRTSR
jgi:hypothetical protein